MLVKYLLSLCKFSLFVDDLKLSVSVYSVEDINHLQQDLEEVGSVVFIKWLGHE